MLTFLKKDTKDENRLQRKRLLELERKKRIFNPRTRLIGVDVEAWEQQLKDKQNRLTSEQNEERKFQELLKATDQLAIDTEHQQAEAVKNLNKKLNQFRDFYQKKEYSREFDLNKKDYLKGREIGRLKLLGEDVNYGARRKFQTEQQRAWLLQQIEEKKTEKIAQEKAARDNAIFQQEKDRRAVRLAALDEQCRKKVEEARKKFNILQAEEMEFREVSDQREQFLQEQVEISNWLNGTWLNEDPDVARSALGPGRIRSECFKGAGDDVKKSVMKFQLQQIQEAEERKEKEKLIERRWAEIINKQEQLILQREKEIEQETRKVRHRIMTANKAIASTRPYRELQPLVEPPSDAFFNQFNQSSY